MALLLLVLLVHVVVDAVGLPTAPVRLITAGDLSRLGKMPAAAQHQGIWHHGTAAAAQQASMCQAMLWGHMNFWHYSWQLLQGAVSCNQVPNMLHGVFIQPRSSAARDLAITRR
jgi:hypothetical protein